MPNLWTKLTASLRAFNRSRSGNVAITFAIATLPIIGAVGAAVDYSRANSVKAAMQAALDSTALMLSRDAASLSATQLQTKAQNYFLAMFNRPDANSIVVAASYSTTGGSQVLVNGQANVPTALMSAVGYDSITVKGSSTAKWGSTRLRVALALDNTPSMNQSGKMTALKDATRKLLNQLKAAAGKDGDVYVSIVPFSTDVNVGSGNVNASWIDWSLWDAENGRCSGGSGNSKAACEAGSCSISGKTTKSSCEAAGECSRSQYTSKRRCENNGYRWSTGQWTNGGTWQVDRSKWTGCVMDRDKDPNAYNTKNTTPSGTTALFPADPNDNRSRAYCSVSVLPQTYNWTALQSKVDDMDTELMTNTTIGLVHAWQTLTDGVPYSPPAINDSDGIKTRKIIIFLTDGENTQDRYTSRASDIDDRMTAACTNAKADGITIFTVLMLDGNESLLKSCASPDDTEPKGPKYFKLTASSQVATAFEAIGTSLTKLRVAK
jgi:Flp pilus assembly protein TadG